MKTKQKSRLVFILLSIALFSSCSSYFMNKNYPYIETDLDTAWTKTASFSFIEEDAGDDYCKSPLEFEADGGGDCEDFVTYMVYLLGNKSSMIILRNLSTGGLHAVVGYDGKWLEASVYNKIIYDFRFEAIKTISYDEVMEKATKGGIK